MFNLILTKNLYLVELATIERMYEGKIWYYTNSVRYSLARYDIGFIDVFTRTRYKAKNSAFCGEECVINAKAIITDKKFLSKKELIYIMQELNPTYISKKEKVKKFNR